MVEAITADAAGYADDDGVSLTVDVESVSPAVVFPEEPRARIVRALSALGEVPVLPTAAGHDAGVLSEKVPTAMLFVRNPTGVSHSPDEYAEIADCRRGAEALADGDGGLGGPVTDTWWCEHAWLGDGVADGVRITVDDGRDHLDRNRAAPQPESCCAAWSFPGLANAHSHAFHRALRSHTQRGGGSFWTWRELMYDVAERLTPETYLALARAAYAEMALAGITAVGEFHYLHHGSGGQPYADPNAMGQALVAAAARRRRPAHAAGHLLPDRERRRRRTAGTPAALRRR